MTQYDSYINKIVTGEIIAGETIKQAVDRHLNDLKLSKKRSFDFYFDEKIANTAIKIMQIMPLTSSREYQGFPLQDWQAFIVAMLHGWRQKKSKVRRFKKAYIKVARKNGKTEFLAALANLEFLIFPKETGEIFWAATKRDQAKIGWERQKRMITKLSQYDKYVKQRIITNARRIIDKKFNMFSQPLGRDSKTEDGHLVYWGIIDEYHAHPDDSMVNILETGMGAFDEPLLIIITTAGYNLASACKTFEDTCKDVLKGEKQNDYLFIAIYDLDKDDDWEDETVWIKANPGLGISPKTQYLHTQYQNARTEGVTKKMAFKVKNLNIWTNTTSEFIESHIWQQSGKHINIHQRDLAGLECYAGLDLASTIDITAFVMWFKLEEGFAMLPYFFIPEDTARKRAEQDAVKYLDWIDQGYIITTPGDVTDYDYLLQFIVDMLDKYDIRVIHYDRWNSSQLVNNLVEKNAPMIPFGQGFRSMAAPTKEFERLALRGDIKHFNNPVFNWMLQNVQIERNPEDQIKISKRKSREKIDGVAALINAIGAWLIVESKNEDNNLPDNYEINLG